MIEAQEYPNEGREAGARADFVASLGRRLAALRGGLREVESEPRSAARRDMLLRRIHALGAAAGVLGFDEVQAALGSAEQALRRGGAEVTTGDIAEVSRALELVPSLVWGAKLGNESAVEPARLEPDHAWPLCVLVIGAASLGDGLTTREDGIAIEHEHADEPARAVEIARTIAPDVVVVDADRHSSAEVVDELLERSLDRAFRAGGRGQLRATRGRVGVRRQGRFTSPTQTRESGHPAPQHRQLWVAVAATPSRRASPLGT